MMSSSHKQHKKVVKGTNFYMCLGNCFPIIISSLKLAAFDESLDICS
uniref:Uncharacterized protein n=1 Tax=Rhizophora mucronata TaxID=61149 RepID=A0A2P2NKN0_RHIMU